MQNFDDPNIKIQDVMSVTPTIIKKSETVSKAAALMKESGVGSLVVLDDSGELEGIVTEMDIVFKTVAEGLDPKEVKVKEIMSCPVNTISGTKSIRKAAETMAKLQVRRLPVMRDGKLIGIITENDIIVISPALLDITREFARIHYPERIEGYEEPNNIETSGYCESCKVYSEQLTAIEGMLLCPECSR
ncbi:MAG: CBS domain-containing protein [Thermoplasmata archaeon]